MKKYNVDQAREIIIQAAKEYDTYLCDKHFLVVYQKGKNIEHVSIGFRDYNFLHLTGVKTRLSAQMFYSACISRKLSKRDIAVDQKGKVQQKLNVLPYLGQLLYKNCMIGDFINSGILIKADYFVGDTRAVLSVGFKQGNIVDAPVTLYNEDVRKLSEPTCKVLAIFSKMYDEDKYNECTYLSKGQDISKFPKEIQDSLNDEIK